MTIRIGIVGTSWWTDAHNTYHDVFRKQNFMAREWVNAIAHDLPIKPDFGEGAFIQRVIEAAQKSASERRFVALSEI